MQTSEGGQEERPGDLARGCADGCAAGCGLWVLATLGLCGVALVLLLVGACAQAIFEF